MFKKVSGLFRPEKKEESKDNRGDQVAHDLRAARRPSSPIIGIDSFYGASLTEDFQQDNSNIRFLSRDANRPNTEAESNSVAQEVDYSGLFEGLEGKVSEINKVERSKFNQFYTTRDRSNTNQRNMSQWVSDGRVGSQAVAGSGRENPQQPSPSAKRAKDSGQFNVYRRLVAQRQSGVGMPNSNKDMSQWVSDGRRGASGVMPPPPVETSRSQFATTRTSKKNMSQWVSGDRRGSSGVMPPPPPPPPPVETSLSQFATTRRSSGSSSAAHEQNKNVEIPRGAVSSSVLSSLMPPAPPQQQQSGSQFASNREGAKMISRSSADLPPQKRQKIQLNNFVKVDESTGNVKREEFKVEITNEAAGLAKGWLNVARQSLAIKKIGER